MLEPRSHVADGERAALPASEFEDVYVTFSPRLRKIATAKFRIAPADAEALVQDVFTTFFMHAKSVEKVEAYLVGAICNASKNHLRNRGTASEIFCDEMPCGATLPDEAVAEIDRKLLLSRLMARVGHGCRELMHRYYIRGEDTQTIASELELTRGTVKVNLHKCRQRLLEAYHALMGRR